MAAVAAAESLGREHVLVVFELFLRVVVVVDYHVVIRVQKERRHPHFMYLASRFTLLVVLLNVEVIAHYIGNYAFLIQIHHVEIVRFQPRKEC